MDANQLKLYIEQNIKSQEPGIEDNPRLALELEHFTQAIVSQLEHHKRTPTGQQIESAWERWKLERIEYTQHVKAYASDNAKRLEDFAAKRVAETEVSLQDDEQLTQEAKLFKQAYGKQLQHLSKQPLPEHVDMAWTAWKKGYRF